MRFVRRPLTRGKSGRPRSTERRTTGLLKAALSNYFLTSTPSSKSIKSPIGLCRLLSQ